MAYNYGLNSAAIPTATGIPQQNVQPLFPQPQGNVYSINSTLEVANVPVGAGMSIALCLPENVMYIKTMQNGNPLFYPYRIEPLNGDTNTTSRETTKDTSMPPAGAIEEILTKMKAQDDRIAALEALQNKSDGGFKL